MQTLAESLRSGRKIHVILKPKVNRLLSCGLMRCTNAALPSGTLVSYENSALLGSGSKISAEALPFSRSRVSVFHCNRCLLWATRSLLSLMTQCCLTQRTLTKLTVKMKFGGDERRNAESGCPLFFIISGVLGWQLAWRKGAVQLCGSTSPQSLWACVPQTRPVSPWAAWRQHLSSLFSSA